jgi:hypothetical protein
MTKSIQHLGPEAHFTQKVNKQVRLYLTLCALDPQYAVAIIQVKISAVAAEQAVDLLHQQIGLPTVAHICFKDFYHFSQVFKPYKAIANRVSGHGANTAILGVECVCPPKENVENINAHAL